MRKVILAYSGGLDTSVILKWLQEEKNLDVVTYTADLGQGDISDDLEENKSEFKSNVFVLVQEKMIIKNKYFFINNNYLVTYSIQPIPEENYGRKHTKSTRLSNKSDRERSWQRSINETW